MKTSPNGRKFIEGFEGLYLHTYDDGTGTLTIGYGHTTAAGPPVVHRGMTITKDEADAILAADLASVEANVNHLVKVPVNQDQFDALVSFDFNTGSLRRSNILWALNSTHPVTQGMFDAWDHMRVHGSLVVSSGLLKRRNGEWLLYSTGKVVGP